MSSRKIKPWLWLLALAWLWPLPQLAASPWQNYPINGIFLQDQNLRNSQQFSPFRPLLNIKSGGSYQYQDIRNSIENLYKTGIFANIEVKIAVRNDRLIDIFFVLQKKAVVRSLRFTPLSPLGRRQLQAAVYSLRKNDLYEESKMAKALNELQAFLKSKGYFNAQVSPRVKVSKDQSAYDIELAINYRKIARIRRVTVDVDDNLLAKIVPAYFKNLVFYNATQLASAIEKTRKKLKQQRFNFPEIKVQEEFLDSERSLLDIKISIACGFKYIFVFQGMAAKMSLVSDIWERQVFEKWAEDESRARLLNYLKNDGYLDARITSAISSKGNQKTIVFTVQKNRRYRLGEIVIHGNRALSEEKIRKIITADDLIFNKLFWLRLNSLLVDMEVLKLYYYYQGISPLSIRLEPRFRGSRADIDFFIEEGGKSLMRNVEFSGNQAFTSAELYRLIKSKTGTPYVPRQLNEDISQLQNFYRNNGFDEAQVSYELSAGEEKSLLIKISEKRMIKMGELIIIGASNAQKSLLKKLFPLQPGQPFHQAKIDAFRSEIENNSIFSEFSLDKIIKNEDRFDMLVRVKPDRSRFYGLGFGWEERRGRQGLQGTLEGLHGTLEYQEKNLFNTISSFAATLQLGLNERRFIFAIDTPYFFKNKVASSFKIWNENETYPSYQFNRLGLGASFIKRFSESLYFLGSLRWYRTELTKLSIPEFGIDQLGKPFDTTAFSLSFVKEKRNDPFNPGRGYFLSADLRLGLPLFEKDYAFFKFFWNYQKHYPLFRDGVFSFSVKNGFGFGDMSITERFFAGGSHSFRGTRNDRLGQIHLATNQPQGGNVLFLVNMEITVPSLLIPMEDLYYTFFADVGNIFAKSSDFNLNKMERALGFGLKYRTPLGPIRLDFAFNLRRFAEQNFLIHIGIGNVY